MRVGPPAIALVLLLLAAPPAAQSAPPVFTEDLDTASSSGAFALQWAPPAGWEEIRVEYELTGAGDADDAPDLLYRHFNTKTFVSGLTDGTYTFRVRGRRADGDAPGAWTEWSVPHMVTVEHHDLRLALALCAAGAAVFLFTAAFVIAGARRAEAGHV